MKRLLSSVLLLVVGCACPCDEARIDTPVTSARVAAGATVPMPSSSIDVSSPAPRITRSRRNLFAYYEPPARPIASVVISTPPHTLPPPSAALPPPPEPPRAPHFPYRYIGRFGPERELIAAFTRDGDVRTIRVGERLDEQFMLRAIGIESVDVEARGWGAVIRVPARE